MADRTIELNGINYHLIDRGESERVILLLHGMPDTAQVWRHQFAPLLDAGYRVVAPDMLGYGGTDKPTDLERYRGDRILADLMALLDSLDTPQVDLVGHDWGAYASWELALAAPERIRRHVTFSVGHPDVFAAAQSVEDAKASWYMYINSQPETPALYLANDGAFFRNIFIPTHPELDEAWERLKDPAAMTAMLNWDRANTMASMYLQAALTGSNARRCRVPTLGLWSSGDTHLWEAQIQESEGLMDAPWRYQRIDDASHWLMLDRHEAVNEAMLAWLGAA